MAQFICPSCGSTYFMTSKTGPKDIFKVVSERKLDCVQLDSGAVGAEDIDTQNICCGACSWQGSVDELLESHRD